MNAPSLVMQPGFQSRTAGRHEAEAYYLNMGPQHPSTHGVLPLVIRLDGETVFNR